MIDQVSGSLLMWQLVVIFFYLYHIGYHTMITQATQMLTEHSSRKVYKKV